MTRFMRTAIAAMAILPLLLLAGCGDDPEPNICFQTSAPGWLAYHTDSFSGMALVGAQTLDRTQPISLRAVIKVDTLDCNAGVAYVGPVIYGGGVDDGDPTGNYRAEYISCFGGDEGPKLWLYESIWAGPMPGGPFAIEVGSTHELEIDWYPGDRVDYRLDRQIVFTETANFGHAPLTLQHDPHPALWFGSSTGAIGQFDILRMLKRLSHWLRGPGVMRRVANRPLLVLPETARDTLGFLMDRRGMVAKFEPGRRRVRRHHHHRHGPALSAQARQGLPPVRRDRRDPGRGHAGPQVRRRRSLVRHDRLRRHRA
jgi:hypothetical protein